MPDFDFCWLWAERARSSEFPETKRIRTHNVCTIIFSTVVFPTLRHGRYIQFSYTAIQFVANFHSENNFHCYSTYAIKTNHIKLDIYLIFDICYVIIKHFVKIKYKFIFILMNGQMSGWMKHLSFCIVQWKLNCINF